MTDEKKTYRVTDRRHFTPEGESVTTDAATEEPETPGSAAGSTGAAPPSAVDAGELPADFTALILTLGTQASVLLRGAEGSGPDLRGARWVIDILEMLQQKTDGRRTPEETEALEALLYELRMAYVSFARTGGV